MIEQAGNKKTITLTFDDDTKSVVIEFDKDKFRNWEFVVAVQQMALEQTKHKLEMARMAGYQMQAMQAAQEQEIRRRIVSN